MFKSSCYGARIIHDFNLVLNAIPVNPFYSKKYVTTEPSNICRDTNNPKKC